MIASISFTILKPALWLGVLFAVCCCCEANETLRIDGGDEYGWDQSRWYVQVDGVMGGKSSGQMEFLSNQNNDQVMRFTGDINLDGGGFSSLRRRIQLDLSDYAGVVVTLKAALRSPSSSGALSSPTGLELQFGNSNTRYDFSAAFAVPLSSSDDEVTSVYLPIESFDRGAWIGFRCQDGCRLDPSSIEDVSLYVLYQEGAFDVQLLSIEAVTEPRSFPPPAYDGILQTPDDTVALITSTIRSGGSLYDKDYPELCVAVYWSVLNTILSAPSPTVVSGPTRAVICAGLQQAEAQTRSGSGGLETTRDVAWTLRYAMDAVLDDLAGASRTTRQQSWLPSAAEAEAMEAACVARTSPAPGAMYDPTNTNLLPSSAAVSDDGSAAADIPTTAFENGSFTTLVAALDAASLVDALSTEGPFTVFAPTDDAFAALPAALVPCLLLPENKGALTRILTYHVADGSVVSADLSDGQEVPTLEGGGVTIDISDAGVKVNGANVVIADVAASNGVIHAIDNVLVPPSIDVAAFLETCSPDPSSPDEEALSTDNGEWGEPQPSIEIDMQEKGEEKEEEDEDEQPDSGIETEPAVPSVDGDATQNNNGQELSTDVLIEIENDQNNEGGTDDGKRDETEGEEIPPLETAALQSSENSGSLSILSGRSGYVFAGILSAVGVVQQFA